MKTEKDDNVIEWLPLKSNNIKVKRADHDGGDDIGYIKKISSQPCHLGAFISTHSKGLLNDAIFLGRVQKPWKILFGYW